MKTKTVGLDIKIMTKMLLSRRCLTPNPSPGVPGSRDHISWSLELLVRCGMVPGSRKVINGF